VSRDDQSYIVICVIGNDFRTRSRCYVGTSLDMCPIDDRSLSMACTISCRRWISSLSCSLSATCSSMKLRVSRSCLSAAFTWKPFQTLCKNRYENFSAVRQTVTQNFQLHFPISSCCILDAAWTTHTASYRQTSVINCSVSSYYERRWEYDEHLQTYILFMRIEGWLEDMRVQWKSEVVSHTNPTTFYSDKFMLAIPMNQPLLVHMRHHALYLL